MCEWDFTEDAILNWLFTISSFLDRKACSDLFLNTSYLQAFEEPLSSPKVFMSPHRAAFFHHSPPAQSLETVVGRAFCSSKGSSPYPSRAQGTARTASQHGVCCTPASGDAAGAGFADALADVAGLLYLPPASRGEGPASSTHGDTEWESGWRLKLPSDSDPRQASTSDRATRCRAVCSPARVRARHQC